MNDDKLEFSKSPDEEPKSTDIIETGSNNTESIDLNKNNYNDADFKELLDEAPQLTLEPFSKDEIQTANTPVPKPEESVINEPELTEEEKRWS